MIEITRKNCTTVSAALSLGVQMRPEALSACLFLEARGKLFLEDFDWISAPQIAGALILSREIA